MLNYINIDILIKILFHELLKLQYVSKYLYNIIHNNKEITNKIIKKYYYNFNLYKIIPSREICYQNTKDIKNISIFFDNNLSKNEKKIFKTTGYIAPKRYYWFHNIKHYNTNSFYINKYINFFILYYNLIEYDKLVQKLNIYVENNNIISIEIPLTYTDIKHYILYKNNNQYKFILKPDNILDDNIKLINQIISKFDNYI